MEKNVSTIVEGMTCGNCALTISRFLEKKGMRNISTNAASGEVNFTASADTDITSVYDAIDGLGYRVVRGEEESEHAGIHTDQADTENLLFVVCLCLTVPLLLHMFISWPLLHNPWFQLALSTPVFAIGCYAFVPPAIRSLKHRMPNMDVLIMLGATAAYVYSLIGLLFFAAEAHQYLFFETTASIITLVMAGNWLEHRTVKSTTIAIDALVKLQPRFARLVMTDSQGKESIIEVESKYVRNGDIVLVNTGDHIPVDGTVIFGQGEVDEKMLTGESLPVYREPGMNVVGGTMLVSGSLKLQATAVGNASVLSNIIRMVREAQGAKSPLQRLADRISAIFVPAVFTIAVLTLLINYFLAGHSFPESMMRSIAVMVISCPCAMGLATPAAVAVGLGRAARNGMLIKGGDTLSALKSVRNIVFDKTGTLTTGTHEISEFKAVDISDEVFRCVVAAIEQHSSHPIARSVTRQWTDSKGVVFTKVREISGKGMEATDSDGRIWQLGSEAWLHSDKAVDRGFDLYLYCNGQYAGAIRITDTLRPDAAATVRELQSMGYRTVLLSGDKEEKVKTMAKSLGFASYRSEQTPQKKKEVLRQLLEEAPTAMVGDGINDAPALAMATVGISLSESTQIAIQSAQVILSNNQLSSLPRAIRLGKYTDRTIRENLFWAFLYNIVAIPVAAAGYLSPTWGAGIMALSDVVLVINSLRLGFRRI